AQLAEAQAIGMRHERRQNAEPRLLVQDAIESFVREAPVAGALVAFTLSRHECCPQVGRRRVPAFVFGPAARCSSRAPPRQTTVPLQTFRRPPMVRAQRVSARARAGTTQPRSSKARPKRSRAARRDAPQTRRRQTEVPTILAGA